MRPPVKFIDDNREGMAYRYDLFHYKADLTIQSLALRPQCGPRKSRKAMVPLVKVLGQSICDGHTDTLHQALGNKIK